jgi:hypothetical protein
VLAAFSSDWVSQHGTSDNCGRLAQLVEQLTLNQRVAGSNPAASTIFSMV